MPTEISSFAELDSADILEFADLLAAILLQADPLLNVSRGSMIWEVIIYPAAVAHVYEATPVDLIREQWNLAAVAAAPTAADNSIVDLLLSNFNISRSAGTKAVGQVEIVLTEAHAMTVVEGTIFTTGALTFTNLADQVVIVAEADRTADSDRVLVDRGDDTYSVKVDVVATTEGVAGNVTYGTSFTVNPRPTYFSSAKAAADLSGGSDPDTNTSVVARATQGLTGKILSNPEGAQAQMLTLVPSSTAASVIGAYSPELTRDQRSLLGTGNGGRADILLRTQASIETALVTVEGTVVDADANTYSVSLDRDDLAGAYDVVSVIAEGDAQERALDIVSEVWGYDVSNLTTAPDIASAQEAAFSRYQTLTITFTDITNTGDYEVRLRRLPAIATAQAYCLNPNYMDALADWVVRSPVPAITSIQLTVMAPSGTTVDTDAVAAAAVASVNSHSFVSELSASRIVNDVSAVLPTGAYISMPIGMDAEIIYPDRVSRYIRSGNTLTVPTVNISGVSKNTVAFFASTETVSVSTEAIT